MAIKAATKQADAPRAPRRVPAKSAAAESHRVVETPTEVRSAEPGPSVLALLTVSTIAAIFVLGIVWFIFFRT